MLQSPSLLSGSWELGGPFEGSSRVRSSWNGQRRVVSQFLYMLSRFNFLFSRLLHHLSNVLTVALNDFINGWGRNEARRICNVNYVLLLNS